MAATGGLPSCAETLPPTRSGPFPATRRPGSIAIGRPSRPLICPISLIAEGQATNSFTRIVANGSMSYLTEGLIYNTRGQENVFLSVNNIPIEQIGFYGNRSVIVISSAAAGKNDKRDSRCVIPYAGNGEAIIFKSPLFCVNFVVGCVDSDTIGAINY